MVSSFLDALKLIWRGVFGPPPKFDLAWWRFAGPHSGVSYGFGTESAARAKLSKLINGGLGGDVSAWKMRRLEWHVPADRDMMHALNSGNIDSVTLTESGDLK